MEFRHGSGMTGGLAATDAHFHDPAQDLAGGIDHAAAAGEDAAGPDVGQRRLHGRPDEPEGLPKPFANDLLKGVQGDPPLTGKRTVGVFQDDERFKELAFRIPKRDGIFGVCSSSGNIGPSVSFGKSGISTVFSDNVILADACATALGNLIRNGEADEMSSALEKIGRIEGVDGCAAISNGLFAMFGDVPELVKADPGETSASSIIF